MIFESMLEKKQLGREPPSNRNNSRLAITLVLAVIFKL